MSTYLATYLDLIPLGYSIVQMQNTLVGNLTANGWQLLAQVDGDHSDLIPPASEAIGTSTFREVVRIYFPNNATITIGSYQVCIADAFGQSILLTAKTAGAVQAGVTINGVTVLGAVGSASSTANDNLQALYYALQDSPRPSRVLHPSPWSSRPRSPSSSARCRLSGSHCPTAPSNPRLGWCLGPWCSPP